MKMYNVRVRNGALVGIGAQRVKHAFAKIIVHHEISVDAGDNYTATGRGYTISDVETGLAIFTQAKRRDAIRCANEELDRGGRARYALLVEKCLTAYGSAN